MNITMTITAKYGGFAIAAAAINSASIPQVDFSSPIPYVVKGGLVSNATSSRGITLIGEVTTWEASRKAKIKALRGKYRDVLTPSDEFLANRAKDIASGLA